ncbi:cupin domain-containing protein [Brevibacillus sp. SYP-B805]|uniref:glucose-6-phosphate isomerase family protein n=1 Tax=Brevibacillus sp. SYP-B805 TaxID=1578199 RepID=UPI0013EAED31|nr:glucose-6-phosphate isomerase family protein [Brevibacillus sp. SYP-B805]NGQ96703.1 cupin domain-containing protein [Brevibacillus sp. SYP-B805]
MEKVLQPFFTIFDENRNAFTRYSSYEERKLSDMKGYFANEARRQQMEEQGNPIVYRVYKQDVPLKEGELLHCITMIEPGHVDGEFFMTKGHYHLNEDCAEIYYGQKGKGLLLMQKGDRTETIEMNPGTVAYIPAGWGHRTVNVSQHEPFVFFSVWPAQSGYNYQRALDEPFQKKAVVDGDSYKLV